MSTYYVRISGVAVPLTRTEWAERELRAAIVTGRLTPGERVPIERLAEEWDISPTPLREAVRSLAGDDLIVLSPQKGARVATISADEVMEIYELRLLLEPHALRLSMRHRDADWRERVEAAWLSLRDAWAPPFDPSDLEPAHTEFHQALISSCGSEVLLRTARQLSAKSLRFRILSAPARAGGQEQAYAEHAELYEASVDADVDRAVALSAAHVGMTVLATLGPEALGAIRSRLDSASAAQALALEGLAGLRDDLKI